jgi:hypothetical protein
LNLSDKAHIFKAFYCKQDIFEKLIYCSLLVLSLGLKYH